jgi:hypothetical protein
VDSSRLPEQFFGLQATSCMHSQGQSRRIMITEDGLLNGFSELVSNLLEAGKNFDCDIFISA